MSGKVHTFTRDVGNQKRRVSLEASASETLEQASFGRGKEVDILTGGQFSIVDLVEAVLALTGDADVDLVTWTAAQFDLTQITKQLESKKIKKFRLVVDRSFVSRAPEFVREVAERFGKDNIRTTRIHAKWVTIRNDHWNVTIRTSMNLNHNARFEYAQVTEDAGIASWWSGIVDEIFVAVPDDGLQNTRNLPIFGHEDLVVPDRVVSAGSQVRTGVWAG